MQKKQLWISRLDIWRRCNCSFRLKHRTQTSILFAFNRIAKKARRRGIRIACRTRQVRNHPFENLRCRELLDTMLIAVLLCSLVCVLVMVGAMYRAGRKQDALVALQRPLLPVCVEFSCVLLLRYICVQCANSSLCICCRSGDHRVEAAARFVVYLRASTGMPCVPNDVLLWWQRCGRRLQHVRFLRVREFQAVPVLQFVR